MPMARRARGKRGVVSVPLPTLLDRAPMTPSLFGLSSAVGPHDNPRALEPPVLPADLISTCAESATALAGTCRMHGLAYETAAASESWVRRPLESERGTLWGDRV